MKRIINYIKNLFFNKNKILPNDDENIFKNNKLYKIQHKIKNIIILEDEELEYMLSLDEEDLKKLIVTYHQSFNKFIKIINSIDIPF